MRILYLSHLYPPTALGGAERLAAALAGEMVRRGHEVLVVTTGAPERGRVEEVVDGVRVMRVFPRNSYWLYQPGNPSPLQKAAWHFRDAWNIDGMRHVAAEIAAFRPHLLHTHNIEGFSPAVWHVARRAGMRVIHTAHDLHLLCMRSNLMHRDGRPCADPHLLCHLWRAWYRRCAAAIDVFCGVSKFTVNRHQAEGVVLPRAVVVPNGVGFGAPSGGRSGPLRLLFMGRLTTAKGLHVLLDAVEALKNPALELHVAGQGELEPRLRASAAAGLPIFYHGEVEGAAKAELFRSCHMLAFPSTSTENAPLSILEAMRSGMAIVASAVGGIPELVQPGRTGWLVPPGDSAVLAGVLRQALAEPALVAQMGQAALAAGMSYSVEIMADRYLDIYTRELSRRGR